MKARQRAAQPADRHYLERTGELFIQKEGIQMQNYETEHLRILRGKLAECTVLLKKDSAFPLEKPCGIAAYGNGVRHTLKGGTGSGEVNSRFMVTAEQGLADAGFTVATGAWLDAYDRVYAGKRKEFVERTIREAQEKGLNPVMYGMGAVMPEPEYELPVGETPEERQAGAAVYVLSRICGEGNDRKPVRGDLFLTETEKKDILALNARYERFMLVLNTGGPVDLSEIPEVRNILVLSQLGAETGAVLADILLGKAVPSGKLSTTWARWEDYPFKECFGDPDETLYREGVYIGYRYFSAAGVRALFPFGYGLSYTEFEHKDAGTVLCGNEVRVGARIKNTGRFAGRETVFVYVGAPEGKLCKAPLSLTGFAGTGNLLPGEEETLTVAFPMENAASFDESRGAWILEAGDYVVYLGGSVEEAEPVSVVSLDSEMILRKVRTAFGKPGFEDWKPASAGRSVSGAALRDLPRLSIPADAFTIRITDYDELDKSEESGIEEAVRALSDEQLVYANLGAFTPAAEQNVVGSAARQVAGAAGETTSRLKEAGFPALVMADGPAGLRLSKEYYRDENGAYEIGGFGIPETMAEFLPEKERKALEAAGVLKAPEGKEVLHQYCTAIPIGTALAQSFDLSFAESCGDIVGREMERFGVQFWLAPALNIHRSVLCGRNFEYFSEDPLVSGRMAAALTKGVQKHKGRAVTIKHFAANNQETNRNGNNSRVSERALREIYLRGFEYCIREARPVSVMSSYNLLNGVHTSERRDLCRDVLRAEFGFDGLLMTDWVVRVMEKPDNRYREAREPEIASAGTNLMMPGEEPNFTDLMEALKNGKISRKQLEINASGLLRTLRKLA